MTTALVIGRRRRGRPIREAVRETERLLEAAGWQVQVSINKKKGSVRRRTADAAKSGVDVVVAVGGDGAVQQVVQGLAETRVALGIVPMGTGNLLATNLRIPRRLERAVQVVLDGKRRQIDLGQLTLGRKQRYFAVACGIGFDAQVMDATTLAEKRRWGKLAYAAKAVAESRGLRDVGHRIVLDGKETAMDAGQVLIANFGRTGLGPHTTTADRARRWPAGCHRDQRRRTRAGPHRCLGSAAPTPVGQDLVRPRAPSPRTSRRHRARVEAPGRDRRQRHRQHAGLGDRSTRRTDGPLPG